MHNISQKTRIYTKKRPVRTKKDISKKPLRIENTVGCAKFVERHLYIRKRTVCTKRDLPKRAICTKHTLSCAEHVKRDLNIRGKSRNRLDEETHIYRNHDEVCKVCQKSHVNTKKRPARSKRDASKRPVYIENTTRCTNYVKRDLHVRK